MFNLFIKKHNEKWLNNAFFFNNFSIPSDIVLNLLPSFRRIILTLTEWNIMVVKILFIQFLTMTYTSLYKCRWVCHFQGDFFNIIVYILYCLLSGIFVLSLLKKLDVGFRYVYEWYVWKYNVMPLPLSTFLHFLRIWSVGNFLYCIGISFMKHKINLAMVWIFVGITAFLLNASTSNSNTH